MIKEQTPLQGLKRLHSETLNSLQVVTYKIDEDNTITTVRTGKTLKGTLLFESNIPDAAKTFAMLHDELIGRRFKIHEGGEGFAWFSRQFPNHMLGTEQYDIFRGKLVRFEEPLEGEKLGYIKIY